MKLDLKGTEKLKPNPLFEGLDDSLKDPANFEATERKIINAVKTSHLHQTVKSYMNCKECQAKFRRRQRMVSDLGFKSLEQYLEWRKIMQIIRNKSNIQLR